VGELGLFFVDVVLDVLDKFFDVLPLLVGIVG
jgi:hypothetical protein